MITKKIYAGLMILFFVFVSLSFLSADHGKVHSIDEDSTNENEDKEDPKKVDGLKDFSSTREKDYSDKFVDVEVLGRGLTSLVSSEFGSLDISLSNAENGKYFDSGDRGKDVEEIQNFLIDQGYGLPKYGADSVYGSETKSAVRDWQAEMGLEDVDGLFGTESLKAAKKSSRSSASNKFIFNYDKSYLEVGERTFENMSNLGRSYITFNPLGKVVKANFTVSSHGGNYSIRGAEFFVRGTPGTSRVLYDKEDGLTLPASGEITDVSSSALDKGFSLSSQFERGRAQPIILPGGGVLFGDATITDRGILVKEGSLTTKEQRPVSTDGGPVLIANENADLSGYKGNWVKSSSERLEIKSSNEGSVSVGVQPGSRDSLGAQGGGTATYTSNNGDRLVVETREGDEPLVERTPSSSGFSTIETGSKEIRLDDSGIYSGDIGNNDFSNLGLDIEANSGSEDKNKEWELKDGSLDSGSEDGSGASHGDEGDETKKILVLAEAEKGSGSLGHLRNEVEDPEIENMIDNYRELEGTSAELANKLGSDEINKQEYDSRLENIESRKKKIKQEFLENTRFNKEDLVDRVDTFMKEGENVKDMYKNDPNTKVEVVPYYGEEEFKNKVRPRIDSLGENEKVAIFGHSGSKLGGVPNEKIANSIEKSSVKNCYIGSCNFEGYIDAYEGIENVYYRPGKPWLGFNPSADSFLEGMFSRDRRITQEGYQQKVVKNSVEEGEEYVLAPNSGFKN